MRLRKTLVRIGVALAITATMAAACGQPVTPPPEEDPYVDPLPADSPEMNMPGPGGVMPCGVGDAHGWGRRVFIISDYPACKRLFPDVTVYCLDAEGNWRDETVANITYSPNEITFDVMQEGLCGIFPEE